MPVKCLLIFFCIVQYIFDICTCFIAERYRKNKKSELIDELFGKEKYERYLLFKTKKMRLVILQLSLSVFVYILTLCSGVFSYLERICSSVYLSSIISYLIMFGESMVISGMASYVYIYKVREEYEKETRGKVQFWKGYLSENIVDFIITIVVILLICLVGEHDDFWDNYYNFENIEKVFICITVYVIAFMLVKIGSYLNVFLKKKQYTYTTVQDKELREKILNLGCRDKISEIYVYDESKTSKQKNAFLINGRTNKEIAISDTFMQQLDEKELMAVISHEVGHLKQEKNIWDYVYYLGVIVTIVTCSIFLIYPQIFKTLNYWIRESFNISRNNYYLILLIVFELLNPITAFLGIIKKYKSRTEEYEADRNVVRCGYGNEYIKVLKEVAKDGIDDICIHPFVEFIENDHPCIHNRIEVIQNTFGLENIMKGK